MTKSSLTLVFLLFGLCDRKYVNADLSNILKINFLLMLKLAFPFHLKTSSHFRILSMLLVSLSLFVFTYKYERDPPDPASLNCSALPLNCSEHLNSLGQEKRDTGHSVI